MKIAGKVISPDAPAGLFGILNLTPDSFYDGGRFLDPGTALEQALRLESEGADIIDIGGESSRPGSEGVPEAEEMERVLPVIRAVRGRSRVPLSVDTRRAAVAEAALSAGADCINDISALLHDPAMASVAAAAKVPVVLMHMQGAPKTMQQEPRYENVVREVGEFLLNRAAFAESRGVLPENIILDPGIGFGKNVEHNCALIRGFAPWIGGRYPVLIGHSRKSFIGRLLDLPSPEDRLFGSLGAAAAAVLSGARFLRVHDVRATREMLSTLFTLHGKEPCLSLK